MAVRMITLNGDTPESWRLALSLFAFPGATRLDRRGGLAPAGGATIGDTPAHLGSGDTPMTGVVAPFVAWVDGTSGASQGGYIVHSTEWEALNFDPGEASVTRTDRVIIQVRDDAYDSSGSSDARVRVLKGNSGGGATDLPASSELLWEVPVPAGASVGGGGFDVPGVRVDRRRWTVTTGGMLPVKDSTDRDTLTPYEGAQIYDLGAGDPQIYRGGGWRWAGVPRTAVKTADTPRADTATMSADPHLAIAGLVAGGIYSADLFFKYGAHSSADLRIGWTAPSTATMDWTALSKEGADQGDGKRGTPAFDALDIGSMPYAGGFAAENTTPMILTARGVLYAGVGGTLTLRWGQGAAHSTATIARIGSRLTVTRIG